MMHRKTLVTKTLHFGILTLFSRFLGLAREIVRARYLGAGVLGDAFLAAFRLPNSLHKIFAEGIISAALIPAATKISKHESPEQVDKVITVIILITQVILLFFCLIVALFADKAMWIVAPGWVLTSAEPPTAMVQAIKLLPILMLYIFFLSTSSFLAGALQLTHRFSVTAAQPIILNILLIAEFILCAYYDASITVLAWLYVINGLLIMGMSLMAYLYYASFSWPPNDMTWHHVRQVGKKLVPSFINLGIIEINTFIDTQFASFLPAGSISLFSYSSQFMRVPLGIFATTFAIISLPHLARVSNYAPRRLGFHLLESAKAILWLTAPAILLMSFFADDIFSTILVSQRLSVAQAHEAGHLLIASCAGLFFFSMNRILLNMYYALHETFLPTMISLLTVVVNTILNFILMHYFKAIGIVAATSIAGAVQTILFLWFLKRKFNFALYLTRFFIFVYRFALQLICVTLVFYLAYQGMLCSIQRLPELYAVFFTASIGLWLWVGPLSLLMMGALWITRKQFGIKIYYFD